MSLLSLFVALIAAGISGAAAYFLIHPQETGDLKDAEQKLKEAEAEAKQIAHENKERILAMQKAFAAEEASMEETLEKSEKLINQKEEILKRREDRNKGVEEQVQRLKADLEQLSKAEEELGKKTVEELGKRSKLTPEKALEEARANLDELIQTNAEARKKQALEDLEEDASRHAKSILQIVIQRLGVGSSVDKNNTSITVKDDKFKGLLVGKNGINVEYFESLLPVSIIFNLGNPQTIHVGGVNLIRRNIAKRAIEKLQTLAKKKGSIDHELIKQAVDEADKEIMALCDQKGAESLKLLGLDPKTTPAELVNYTGRLYLRTSYGQNVTGHSNEMAFAARMIADAIGADTQVAMQAAFYHDIGKAIDHDVGGAHDDLSKEILEKHGYDPRIVHAAFAHHDKVPCVAPEDFIVKAVDAISGGRPGARQESVTNYFERIQKLEEAAMSFKGVNRVFAMSAGRELRVMVDRDRIQDSDMQALAESMADKIEEEVAFPGVIKVNLIRTTKSVDYARELHKPRK
ncbi:MAG: Rnase Y domain-containing protein [Candidatus Gracilibacteria bacterium]|jgi:ribonuclease Y